MAPVRHPLLRNLLTATAVVAIAAAATLAGDGDGAAARIPVRDFFKGKVRFFKKGVVEIAYDFSDAAQLTDFEAQVPFQAIQDITFKIDNGGVRLVGTGSMRFRGVFDDKVAAEADFTPVRNRDFGFVVTEERGTDTYTLYCCYDIYFSLTDGVDKPQNMIIKFLPKAARMERDGLQDWRYCGSRGQKPEIVRGKTYHVTATREGIESRLDIDDWRSKGKEAGRDLVSPMIGVYGHTGDVRFDDLRIRGRLSPAFIERHNLDMTSDGNEEDEPPETPPEEVERLRALIAGYPFPTPPLDLAKLLRDTTVPEAFRAQAVERAVAVGNKTIVPYLLPGLYAEDEESRAYSFEVFKALCNKTYSYRPDANDDARTRSLKKINEHLEKNAADYR